MTVKWIVVSAAFAGLLVVNGCSDSNNASGKNDAAVDAGTDAVSPADGANFDGSDAGSCAVAPPPAPGACAQSKMAVFTGAYQLIINKLEIGGSNVGFDLDNADCDGDAATGADNVLWTLGALAKQSIDESMARGDIIIPIEFFDLDEAASDDCTNFALYYGRFPLDRDQDGQGAGGPADAAGKDCNDTDDKISGTKAEVAGNGVDDDCDGLADEDDATSPPTPSADDSDGDGDGQSLAAGDCDDRKGFGETVKKGGVEICGDGLDNDCSGRADDGCLPWSEQQTCPLEAASVDANDEGVITFRGARVVNGVLQAGPSVFSLAVDVKSDAKLDLNLTNVFVRGELVFDAKGGLQLKNGTLGGVLGARAMDQAPNLIAEFGGGGFGTVDDSLLDALVGPAGMLLALPTDAQGNRVPDIDVDGDGVEKFIDTDMDGDTETFRVDTCVDGDGTEVKDKVDAAGKVTEPCTLAKDAKGNYRFVDGWSISLLLEAVPTKLQGFVK